ncbi:MAG: hypothetical protein GWP91_04330 [Rhodobacterales bacterium]|nr:hypothetical protein [Rhodobacterales bacterium]
MNTRTVQRGLVSVKLCSKPHLEDAIAVGFLTPLAEDDVSDLCARGCAPVAV